MDANLTRKWAPLTAIVSGRHKFIDLPVPELYDLTADPREMSNLFPREREEARRLQDQLRSTAAALAAQSAAGPKMTVGAEARQRLEALGYVASSAGAGATVYTDADDPKALIGVANELNRAIDRFSAGDRAAAVSAVTAIIKAHPRFSTAYAELARMQRSGGDLPAAIRTLEDAARRSIANQRMMTVLAGYFAESRQLDQAKTILEAVLADHPDDVEALNSFGVVSSRMGDHETAQVALMRAIDLDPTSARSYANLAADSLSAGRLDAAIPDLRRAVELDRYEYDALFNLGMALWQLGRHDEASPHLERFAREAPPRYADDAARVQALLRTKK
jgi:tetratricopeptide (TPR) repeat protein